MRTRLKSIAVILLAATLSACHEVDNTRIPYADVYVDLSYNWDIYGVHSLGDYKYFIRSNDTSKREPSNFSFNATTKTGYGGLLLTCDAQNQPLVYDLACPYERSSSAIVRVDPDNVNEVECSKCGSRFNVTEFYGSATYGPAKEHRYGLTRYTAYPVSQSGSGYATGYILRR